MIIIEEMSKDEALQLSNLHGLCFEKYWSEKEFLDFYHHQFIKIFLIKEQKEIIAFLVTQIIASEAEIYTFCTHPNFRNQGIAAKLIEYFKIYVKDKNISEIFLEVSETNLAAREFYKKFGFSICDVRKGYYLEAGRQVDAFVMKWKNNPF